MDKTKNNPIATNSFILIFVQVLTLVVSMVQAAILSRTLTKAEYGTYSQGLMIVAMAAPILLMGLSSAVNYFYNKSDTDDSKKYYTKSILGYTSLLGLIGGVIILIFHTQIAGYFSNPELGRLIVYIAFRPLIENLVTVYYPLYISNGMTKTVALRNLLISITKVAITVPISIFIKNLSLIFALLLVMDIIQLIILANLFSRRCFKINPFAISNEIFDKTLARKIFSYAIPLGLSTLTGVMTINIDKLFVGRLLSVEDFALYSNMSKELPFGFIVSSFTAVVMPVMITLVARNDNKGVINLWSDYFEIGYVSSWALTTGALICAPELLGFLYSSKYADGLPIFIVFILMGYIRITYYGLMLTTHGKTQLVLYYSILTLILNFVLNIILYPLYGMFGLAMASLLSIFFTAMCQLIHGSKISGIKLGSVVKPKIILTFILKILMASAIVLFFKYILQSYVPNMDNIILLIVCYTSFIVAVLAMHWKRIRSLIRSLNSSRV